ncbi:hypothetical protein DL768_009783 [Monosporascus sp. mg162]|nr:hypothetical protein DL768_009783 [Monosporascus sp. mg162]
MNRSSRSTPPDDKLKAFTHDFYTTSDDPDRDEKWVTYFAPDAVRIMRGRLARGPRVKFIRRLRRATWDNVRSRRHSSLKALPAAPAFPDLDGDGRGRETREVRVHAPRPSGPGIRGERRRIRLFNGYGYLGGAPGRCGGGGGRTPGRGKV